MCDISNQRKAIKDMVSDVVWALIDFPVKSMDVETSVVKTEYETLFEYLVDDDLELCVDLGLDGLIEFLGQSDMFVEVG